MSKTGIAPISLFGQKAGYRSPTLQKIHELKGINAPATLCSHCPLAVWFDQAGLWCHCSHLHRSNHDASTKWPITMCDAREGSIARLEVDHY